MRMPMLEAYTQTRPFWEGLIRLLLARFGFHAKTWAGYKRVCYNQGQRINEAVSCLEMASRSLLDF